MTAQPVHSGEMSQDSPVASVHRSSVAVDPAARKGKRLYEGMSASSIGLELGLSVVIGLLGGMWLDSHFETTPWLMFVGLGFGLVAGFRGVMRAVRKEDRLGARDAAELAAQTAASASSAVGEVKS